MITSAEVHRVAAAEGLRFDQIEKDYVILWLLTAFSRVRGVVGRWTLKGGTCLRHCYYPNYRFSDDIDFSCEPEADSAESSFQAVTAAAQVTEAETGLRLGVRDPVASSGEEQLEIRVEYSRGGPRRQRLPVVKVHLTFDEPLIRPPERRVVRPAYSDLEEFDIACYGLSEIVVEKLRSLLQQQEKWPRPRDLYDLWFIVCERAEPLCGSSLLRSFESKCRARGIVPDPMRLFSDELRGWNRQAWADQLAPTMRTAPDYERVWHDWTGIRAKLF